MGKIKITQITKTQRIEIQPITGDHLPRWKGPLTNTFRPDVLRKYTGIMYDMYSPITATEVMAVKASGTPFDNGKFGEDRDGRAT